MFLQRIGLLATSSGHGYKYIPDFINDGDDNSKPLTETSRLKGDNKNNKSVDIQKNLEGKVLEGGTCYEEESSVIGVNHNISSHVRKEEGKEYILYPERWKVLFSFSVLTCINGWIWITWSPLAPALTSFWSLENTSEVDNLSSVYLYVYIPIVFPALYLLNKYRLRKGLLGAALLNFIGAICRHDGMHSYAWVYFGTTLCAIAQTITLSVPPLLSGIWFGADERGLATSLGVIANQLGVALGLGMTVFIDLIDESTAAATATDLLRIDEKHLDEYIGFQKALSGIAFGLVFLWVKTDEPKTPPSQAAAALLQISPNNNIDDSDEEEPHKHNSVPLVSSTPDYVTSIQLFFKTHSGLALFIVYGIVVGVFYAISTFLAQMFLIPFSHGNNDQKNWTTEEAGYLGLIFTLIGLLGPIISGKLLDRNKAYRGLSIVLLLGSSVAMTLFTFVIKYYFLDRIIIYISIGCIGFFLTAFISIGFEYGSAISYPADEAAVAGILNLSAQAGGWILILHGGKRLEHRNEYEEGGIKNVLILNEIFVGTLVFSLLLFLVVAKAQTKRPGK